jgi:cytochrome c556
MKRLTIIAATVTLLGTWSICSALADESKTPTVKEVMQKLHRGKNSPLALVGAGLKTEEPDWAKLQKQSKSFLTFGAALAKNDPPRGTKESWQKLSLNYFNDANALDAAVQKENKSDAQSAYAKIRNSCSACHRAHRKRRN